MRLAIVGNDIDLYMMYMHCDYGDIYKGIVLASSHYPVGHMYVLL